MDSMEDKLRQALYRHDCPDPLRLGEYHLDLLPPPDRQSIAEHLGFCPHCRLEVARLAGFLTATRETPGRPDEPSLLEKVQVFLVDLLAPTGGDAPRPAALRTAGDPLQDQTQFRVHRLGDYLVSITIQPPGSGDRVAIMGDLANLEDPAVTFESWTLHVWQHGRLLQVTPVDAGGGFTLEIARGAPFELILSGPEVEIHLRHPGHE